MNQTKIIFIVLFVAFCLALSGCTRTLDLICRAEEREPLALQSPDTLQLNDLRWFIVTRENFNAKFDALNELGYSQVFFGLTDEGYESLSINTKKTQNHILQQNLIIEQYKKYYETIKE
jgi:hypothetical protein